MSLAEIPQYESSGGDVTIIEEYERDHSSRLEALLRTVRAGSAGVVVLVSGYGPYMPYVGTSPSVVDSRSMGRIVSALTAVESTTASEPFALRATLALSVADQAREVLATLSLNKTQLAEVLGVSRPTLYDWLGGKEPNVSNAQRLTTLLRILTNAGVTSSSPLNARLVRQALTEQEIPLLEALRAEMLDEHLVSSLVRQVKALGEQAEARRIAREERLRSLGFEDTSDEQRRDQLARNVATRDWPRT